MCIKDERKKLKILYNLLDYYLLNRRPHCPMLCDHVMKDPTVVMGYAQGSRVKAVMGTLTLNFLTLCV